MSELTIRPLEERLETRAKILRLEELIKAHPNSWEGDSEICPLTHEFPPGLYVRTIFIPAGTVVTGKLHRHEHPNILQRGIVEVATEFGGTELLKGPLFMISKGLTKRALMAVTDLVWTTIHPNPTESRDHEQLVRDLTIEDLTEYKEECREYAVIEKE